MQDKSRSLQIDVATDQVQKQSSLEKAIRALTLASQAGQLPGTIYGRLHSIIRLKSISSAEPVNSVLHEICRMVRYCELVTMIKTSKMCVQCL